MILTLNARATLTLPAKFRASLGLAAGDAVDVSVKNGAIVVTPVAVIPKKLYLTKSGKKKEEEAAAQIRAGKYRVFTSADALIENLNEDL